MTLEEAIRIQTIDNDHNPDITDTQREAAHQLGIEALKRIKEQRGYAQNFNYLPLSGETEE